MEFEKKKRTALDLKGSTEVLYTCNSEEPWSILATNAGVYINGKSPLITSNSQLQSFAKALSSAMEDYLKLRRCMLVTREE